MNKLTLQFKSLSELAAFSKNLMGGYLVNTNNFTVTARMPEVHVILAVEFFNAILIETSDKVYSYEILSTASAG